MFADNRQISHRQLFRQLILGQLGVFLITVPVTPFLRGRQGVICIVIVSTFFLSASTYFIRIRRCYMHPEKYMGKVFGKLFCLLFVTCLFFTGVFLMLMVSRIAGRFFIEGSNSVMVILITGIICYMGCHQGLERRARMAEVCFPLVIFILSVMMILAVGKVKPVYLEAVGNISAQGIFRGCCLLLAVFFPLFFLPFTLGNVDRAGSSRKALGCSILLNAGYLILALILLQGVFGAGGYVQKEYPLFDLMAGVDFPGEFLERVDIFWIGAVVFCIFYSLGSVFFYNHELLLRGHMEKGAPFTAGAMIAAAVCCEKTGISPYLYGRLLIYIYLPLFLILTVTAGIVWGKGKYHEKDEA